jgi:flagellum-specific ATP synthase
LTERLLSDRHKELASRFIRILVDYENSEDMIRIGAYVKGSHPATDYAIKMIEKANEFLMQPVIESCSIEESLAALEEIFIEQ